MDIEIRPTTAADAARIAALLADAFPEEDLRPLVAALLAEPRPVAHGLLAEGAGRAHGLVVLTPGSLAPSGREVGLLGPLCTAPSARGQGLGGALIRAALALAEARALTQVLVLGDPGYYARFGFRPELAVQPLQALREAWSDAWQACPASPSDAAAQSLILPEPWHDPALWSA
ncbi:MAG: GNAT family N-acetyltransferase [Pseudomonadota bacterium]